MDNSDTDNLDSADIKAALPNQESEQSSNNSVTKKPRSRKWLYIGLSVCILMLVIFVDASNEARKREELETRINEMGGTVIYSTLETGFFNLDMLLGKIDESRWVNGAFSIKTYTLLESLSITDLSALGGLTTIEDLNICHNQIVDLSPLAGLKKLEYLDVSDNPDLTIAEIKKLKKALPNCLITHNATK